MTVQGPIAQCDCGRWVIEEGQRRRVEAAWDRDGAARAVNWAKDLTSGPFRKRNESRLADLAIRLEEYCLRGTLRVPDQLNHLKDEIWEIKAGVLRLPFFHVPVTATGSVRATHGFTKNSQKTPPHEIRAAAAIMKEDLKR